MASSRLVQVHRDIRACSRTLQSVDEDCSISVGLTSWGAHSGRSPPWSLCVCLVCQAHLPSIITGNPETYPVIANTFCFCHHALELCLVVVLTDNAVKPRAEAAKSGAKGDQNTVSASSPCAWEADSCRKVSRSPRRRSSPKASSSLRGTSALPDRLRLIASGIADAGQLRQGSSDDALSRWPSCRRSWHP